MTYEPRRRDFIFAIVLGTVFSVCYAQKWGSDHPKVTIAQGKLQGKTLTTCGGRKVSAFLGIPYAQPPVGHLRFANPVPADCWRGTRHATKDGNQCPQPDAGLTRRQNYASVIGNEDCLYLNVYTPELPDRSCDYPTSLPVMIFVHGGGLYAWSGNSNVTGPGYLLDNGDVVLVTVNYRLGLLGFLSTGDKIASGNWGLKDMVLALRWVQENIANFCGNPNKVTLFGESGGAGAVHLLTLSETTTGLFHQIILQSGVGTATWAHKPRTIYGKQSYELGDIFDCCADNSKSLIACLREIDFKDIISTAHIGYSKWRNVVWGPTDELNIKGAFLLDSPANLMANGCIRDIPWLIGVCKDEGLLQTSRFYADKKLFQLFFGDFDDNAREGLYLYYQPDCGAAWIEAIKSKYFGNDLAGNTKKLIDTMTDVYGDVLFKYFIYKAVEQQFALAKNPQYFYSFEYRGELSFSYVFGSPEVNCGVSQADDLIYIFPSDAWFVGMNKTMSKKDCEMVKTMVGLWTSFATCGTPTAPALEGEKWPPYSTERCYLRIGNYADTELKVRNSLFKDRLPFWTGFTTSPK